MRDKLFWLINYLKRDKVIDHYKDIREKIINYNSAEVQNSIDESIRSILQHAILTVPYYKNILNAEIRNFPVVNKVIVKKHNQDFISDKFRDEPYIKLTTSGSTGTPFTILQDLNKKKRHYADTIFFSEIAGYKVGNILFYLKIWNEKNHKSKFECWKQNIVPVDVLHLDNGIIEDIVTKIKRSRFPKGILSYASSLDQLSNYVKQRNLNLTNDNVKSIIATSEHLNENTSMILSKAFGIKVISRYSNLENGILGQQCSSCNKFHLNIASYFFEILDIEKDIPAKSGEAGRIVVTDLYNYYNPLIRYDTGDLGILSENDDCVLQPTLDRIEGRKLDQIYDADGNIVSSYMVYRNMWKYSEINQFQVVQYGPREYEIVINCDTKFLRENELKSEFIQFLGNNAAIRFSYVNDIPLLSSAKRRFIVNRYKK